MALLLGDGMQALFAGHQIYSIINLKLGSNEIKTLPNTSSDFPGGLTMLRTLHQGGDLFCERNYVHGVQYRFTIVGLARESIGYYCIIVVREFFQCKV